MVAAIDNPALARKRLASVLCGMISRCHSPASSLFRKYGARGLTVCDEWRNDPEAFIAWALSNGYEFGLEIDRKKNHLGYSPSNCRWATRAQNQQNRTKGSVCGGRQMSSRYKGVRKQAKGTTWQAQIHVDGKTKNIGNYPDEVSAARAYNAAALEAFGEFACLNEIP